MEEQHMQFLLALMAAFGIKGNGDVPSLLGPAPKALWIEVEDDMRPHYYGTMPRAINCAFPNESWHQLQYRKRVYKSQTQAKLWQAIDDVKRVVMGDKFTIVFGDRMGEFMSVKRLGHQMLPFENYLWNVVYPRRVLDPNALLVVLPENIPESQNEQVDVRLRIFASKDIMFLSDQMIILADRKQNEIDQGSINEAVRALSGNSGISCNPLDSYSQCSGHSFGYGCHVDYLDHIHRKKGRNSRHERFIILTRNAVFSHQKIGDTWTTSLIYIHNNNNLGAEPLGGVEITRTPDGFDFELTYFESDFGNAVPQMDIIATRDNQLESSTNTTVFPIRVMQGLACETCHGKGLVDKHHPLTGEKEIDFEYDGPDSTYETYKVPCKKCQGTGTVPLGALDSVLITRVKTDAFGSEESKIPQSGNISDKVIGFASPKIEPIKELREQRKDAEVALSESLNITKPSKFAESGVSKEKDREGKYTKLKTISDSMARLARNTAITITQYRHPSVNETVQKEEIDAIKVVHPKDFEIKSVDTLQQEFLTDLEKKPLSLRAKQWKELLKKRFEEDSDIHFIEKNAIVYTGGLSLLTPQERQMQVDAGVIQLEDSIRALRASSAIQVLLMRRELDKLATPEMVKEKVDALLQPFIDEVSFTQEPPTDFPDDGGGDDDEDGEQPENQ